MSPSVTDTVHLAVVFTDVVGSTELSQVLAAEEADEVRRGHFSILRRAIAETDGTEVKNLGDGLMVVFGSSSAALACAVAMQQGVERDNRLRTHPVGLRVGLSAGEVVADEGDYFGEPVVEAARLCAACQSGQILAADVVRAIAGRRNHHECRPLGALSLKGLPDGVETVEVAWEPIAGADIPLPSRLGVRPPVGVVGREPESRAIAEAVKRVAAGGGREVLLVSGEAGLGKTTLLAQSARLAVDDGAMVLFGHCEQDLATPYQLFAEALGHYVTHAPEDELVAHVEAHGSELARMVPALARRIPGLPASKATDPDTERFLLFAATVGLLATVSEHQPVLLVFDDLQWADKGSLLLLRYLMTAEQATRVLVLGAYRDSELTRAHALRETLGVLRGHQGIGRVELAGLDDPGVLAFMEAAAGHTLDADGVSLAHAVYRETDGNPFFVSEVLRHLSETGAIYQDASGHWVTKASLDQSALPDSVREAIGGRVVRLGTEAERVLSLAAVIGRDFDLDLLAKVTDKSEDELLDILDAAAAVALVRELTETSGRYNFSHALIQHTLYEDLGPTRRARAHRQVAEALEALCQDHPGARVGELARHWTSATRPMDLAKAIGYSRQAGDAALGALAPADALRYYAQAQDLYAQAEHPDPVLGIDLAIGLGTAERQMGEAAYRDTLLDAARRAADLGDTDRLVAAALATNRGFFSTIGSIDADKVRALEDALARLPDRHPDRALVLATLCAELALGSTIERRQALADEALEIARAHGDEAVIVRVLNHVAFPLQAPALLDESLARTGEALSRAERLGDPVLTFFAAYWRAQTACQAGDIDEMDRAIDIERALAEQLGQPMLTWAYTFARAWRAMIAGDTARTEELATEALAVGTDSGQPDAALIYGGQLIDVNLQRGTLGDLVPLLEQLAADAPEAAGAIVAALTLAHAEAGHDREVRRLLDRSAAAAFELPLDPLLITGLVWYANAVIVADDPTHAGALFDRLAPWGEQWSSNGAESQGPIGQYLGGLATLLGRYDEADAYFARAAGEIEAVGAKYCGALTGLLWARMLTRRRAPGDVDKARGLLEEARAVASANAYAGVERRAVEALEQLDR